VPIHKDWRLNSRASNGYPTTGTARWLIRCRYNTTATAARGSSNLHEQQAQENANKVAAMQAEERMNYDREQQQEQLHGTQ